MPHHKSSLDRRFVASAWLATPVDLRVAFPRWAENVGDLAMAKQSPAQQETVERVMHEFKHGELEGRDGAPVKSPKQAIAIALHEAGASSEEDSRTNKRNLARTKRKERSGETARAQKEGKSAATGPTKAKLYDEAKRKNIPGRSKMSRADLERAVHA